MGHFTITQFANDTTPSLDDLDENFEAFSVLAPVPCSVAGTNALTFTQNQAGQATSVTISTYENYLALCGVAAQTNTGATTARLGSLSALPIYKDTVAGPVALGGGEIVQGNAFTLVYDSALNSGGGGWHLVWGVGAGNTITPALVRASTGVQVGSTTSPTLTGLLSGVATMAFPAITPGSAADNLFSLAGATFTDALAVGFFPIPSSVGIIYQAYPLAVGNTISVRATNCTSNQTITPGTLTVTVKIIRTT